VVEVGIFQRDTALMRGEALPRGPRSVVAFSARGRVQVVLGLAADGRCGCHFPFLLVISCAGVTSGGRVAAASSSAARRASWTVASGVALSG
jgi:hypothetical protein